jgi:CheY-like chemotaxis protein
MNPKDATILLIEDEMILCDMYKIKFGTAGLRLAIAHGGYEGLAMAKQDHPHLILLDIKMDDLDGFEVLQRLKADPSLAHIPVILLTNMGEKDNAEKGLSLGAEAYIMKAKFLPSEIITKVTERLATINN